MTARIRTRLLAVAVLLVPPLGLATIAAPASQAATSAWVRLAHLSPDTPAVDVYLYPFGRSRPLVVLEHVGYGALSPYQRVTPGQYTVAMRAAQAKPDSPPVISTNVRVGAGQAFTVAGMGRQASLRLQVLTDGLTTPKGQACLRVVQASLKAPAVDVAADNGRTLANDLRFATVTPYSPIAPGTLTVKVTSPEAETSSQVRLTATSIHTIVVLDEGADRIKLLDVMDASGATQMPVGGVAAGLGGTAGTAPDHGWPTTAVALVVALVMALLSGTTLVVTGARAGARTRAGRRQRGGSAA